MRIVIQRVKRASVSVEEKVVGSIQKGFLVLIGVGQGDDEATADKYMKKLLGPVSYTHLTLPTKRIV